MLNAQALLISDDHFIDFVAPANKKNIVVTATMKEIGEILKNLGNEVIPRDKEFSLGRLRELWIHNWTLDGAFKFDTFNYGSRVIRKIKQYKPLPQKAKEHFVVEM